MEKSWNWIEAPNLTFSKTYLRMAQKAVLSVLMDQNKSSAIICNVGDTLTLTAAAEFNKKAGAF